MSSRSEDAPPVSVVAAVLVSDPAALPETVAAVRRQVYEPRRIVVVGGDRAGRLQAESQDAGWAASTASLLASLDPSVTHLWFVQDGAVPRPDALGALLRESARAEAAVAGSKLLRRNDPDRLIAVGIATDVYDVSYLGLDPDEVDQGQYDVVRDVAAVPAASLLIRRDLAMGVGGPDPLLAPEAAAVDLCQRARLRGARIVVVPSSEVLLPVDQYRAEPWREDAGRIRAMLKVYSPITLLWALPMRFLIGFLEALIVPFLGRWTLFGWIRAWVWNLLRLPSTLAARRVARRGRVADDAELYRYQLRGSARLKALVADIGSALRARLPGDEDYSGLAGLGRDLRQPAFIVGALAVGFVALATREIWRNALPASGYSLPFPADGLDAIRAYAGGWNPAGFGSPEPLRPVVGLVGLAQTILLDKPGLTSAVFVVGAFLAGVWGTTRLLRTWGIEAVPGIVAGIVLMAGPAARALGEQAALPTLLALGVLPWSLRIALARFPSGWWPRLGRIAAVAWVTGILAALSPVLLVVPASALLAWAILNITESSAWRAALVGIVGGAAAAALLMPWITSTDLHRFLARGEAFWEPGIYLAIAAGAALLGAVLGAPKRLGLVAAWGGVLTAGGALVARSGEYGPGTDVEHAGLVAVALGTAAVVGASLEAARNLDRTRGWRRISVVAGAVAASLVAASVILVVAPGRAGLPVDQLEDALGFTRNREGDAAASRALLLGPAGTLPGDSRSVRGATYRVVAAPVPELWEAWLPDARAGDDALEAVLESLIDGRTSRAGELLAPFGIRWIVVMGETPLEAVFDGQLDLVPLGGLERTTFGIEGDPVRAVTSNGTAWTHEGTSYQGPAEPGATVILAENANARWQPGEWVQDSWANRVSAAEGTASWGALPARRSRAAASGGLFVLFVVLSWWGRRRS